MKKEIKNNDDEFIIYHSNKKTPKKQSEKEIYNKVLKRQNRNAKIFSLGIFLISFTITWLITTLDFFEEKEMDYFWLLSSVIILLIGTGLLVFCHVTKPKDGKIIYKYKDRKSFIIALVLGFLGILITMAGTDNNLTFFIGMMLIDVAIALNVLHDKTKGKMKKSFIKEFLISVSIFIIAFLIGFLIDKKIGNDDFLYEYSKIANVVYDEIDRPALITKGNDSWYIFTNKYNSSHYELSVSKEPEKLDIVYEIDNAKIINIMANDKYAVWSEYSSGKLIYLYYDKEENQPYKLESLPYNEKEPQVANIGLYKDKIYYEVIDYKNENVSLNVYDISSNEIGTLYELSIDEIDLRYNALNVEENNLLVSICYNGVLQIIHFDLDKYMNKDYKPSVISANLYNAIPYAVSYNNNKYALYYRNISGENISIINKNGKIIDTINTFKDNNYAYLDKIKLKDEKLYYVNYYNNGKNLKASDFTLTIYDLKNKHKSEIKNVFDFFIDNKKIYGLGYYNNDLKNVRLYEIYN